MMTLEIWIALATANFAASVAPGQNVALVGSAAARAGMRGGIAALAGILLAELAWSVLALSFLLGARTMSPDFFTGLQVASVVSLAWIGFGILREPAAGPAPQDGTGGATGPDRGLRRLVLRGLWIGAANPLALVFFLSLLPGFVAEPADLGDPVTVGFYLSAVILSSAAGLVPWLAASGALARTGLARVLPVVSGGALIVIAGAILWGLCT